MLTSLQSKDVKCNGSAMWSKLLHVGWQARFFWLYPLQTT